MTDELREEANAPPDQREDANRRSERGEDENGTGSTETVDGADDPDSDHLSDVTDGSGCTEIWEHLSEERDDDE